MSELHNILRTHNLRRTSSRSDILSMFMEKGVALSEPEIEREMKGRCDRVTIYRTLTTFLDKGILHKVLDDSGAAKYALCAEDCAESSYHSHNHVHFKCLNCGKTTCLESVHIPKVTLPNGYELQETNMLLQGICQACSEASMQAKA